jgi:hypothetical protein
MKNIHREGRVRIQVSRHPNIRDTERKRARTCATDIDVWLLAFGRSCRPLISLLPKINVLFKEDKKASETNGGGEMSREN